MPYVYKLTRDDYGSLNDTFGRVIYTHDWQEIPGNGAYCSETGEGICVGDAGTKLLKLEVMEQVEVDELPVGVTCWRWVRIAEEIPLPEEWERARQEYDRAWKERDRARKGRDLTWQEWKRVWQEYDRAWQECERIVINVIAEGNRKGE